MDIANQMILFAKVVDNGGFSAAARDLGQTPSAVSRQIGYLEDRLGTRLLNRSTKHVTLTEVGREFYPRCAHIARDVSDAEALVLSKVDHPQGTLKIAATSAFAKTQMLPLFPAFLKQNPDLKISLELTDRPLDLVEDKIDVAIRFTEQLRDVSVVARKLASNKRVFCAAPSYIVEHGVPTMPHQLAGHNCLRLSTIDAFNNWTFKDAKQSVIQTITGNFETTSTDALYRATLAGLGIARLSSYLVSDAIKDGSLVRVLPQYIDDEADILAVYSNKKNLSPNVRAFIDFLVAEFSPIPPWERALPENQTTAAIK